MDMTISKRILVDHLIQIRQTSESMFRGSDPGTIVPGISDHEFRDIMDAAIYFLMKEGDTK